MQSSTPAMRIIFQNTRVWIITMFWVRLLIAQTPQQNVDPMVDAKLAAYFESHSYLSPIEHKIAEATTSNSGRKPHELVIEKRTVQDFVVQTRSTPINVSPLLLSVTANTGVMLMGTPLSSRPLLTKDHAFIFTTYDVRVDRIFLDTTGRIRVGDTISISRMGGNFTVNEVNVKAVDPAFDQFSINAPYIFALNVIPGTAGFVTTPLLTYIIQNGRVTSASKPESKFELWKPLSDFISDVEAAETYRQKVGRPSSKI